MGGPVMFVVTCLWVVAFKNRDYLLDCDSKSALCSLGSRRKFLEDSIQNSKQISFLFISLT